MPAWFSGLAMGEEKLILILTPRAECLSYRSKVRPKPFGFILLKTTHIVVTANKTVSMCMVVKELPGLFR